MIYLVIWQDVVGKEFLETFVRMAKSVYYEMKDTPNNTDDAIKKAFKHYSEEDRETYRKKLRYMSKCGYEKDENIIRWHGYMRRPYLNGKGGVMFPIFGRKIESNRPDSKPHDLTQISLHDFLEFKKGSDHMQIEDEYYREKDGYPTQWPAKDHNLRPTGTDGFVKED